MLDAIRSTNKFESATEEELSSILDEVKKDFLAGKGKSAGVNDVSERLDDEDIEQENIVRG